MIPEPRTVPVGEGRVVGVYEYGDPGGDPIMVFHGVPTCGAGFVWADQPARQRGLRLFAPDRPGVGVSTRMRRPDGYRVGDYPAMVADLADALGIDQFGVWGYSGGGPYAVACAAVLDDRVTRVAVAAGMGQVGVWASVDDFEKTDRQMLKMVATRPVRAGAILSITARLARTAPRSAMKSFARQMSESDRRALSNLGEPAEAMALFTSAFTRGARGVVDDYRAIGRGWGVDVGAISVPFAIFQGDDDPMVPLRHAEALAQRVPGAELTVWPGEGHLGTVTHVAKILDWLAPNHRRNRD